MKRSHDVPASPKYATWPSTEWAWGAGLEREPRRQHPVQERAEAEARAAAVEWERVVGQHLHQAALPGRGAQGWGSKSEGPKSEWLRGIVCGMMLFGLENIRQYTEAVNHNCMPGSETKSPCMINSVLGREC